MPADDDVHGMQSMDYKGSRTAESLVDNLLRMASAPLVAVPEGEVEVWGS
mgnify:CR=1 FL=1